MFFACNGIERKAEDKHGNSYGNPAKAKVIKRQGAADVTDKAQRDTNAINCIDHTDNCCAKDCKRIDKSVAANKFVTQTQHNQHDGNRIDCVQNGNRNAEDCIKSLVANCKGKDCDTQYKFGVANAVEQG